MTDREQIKAFADELDNLVNRFADEFNLTTAAAVGVLMIKAQEIIYESANKGEER